MAVQSNLPGAWIALSPPDKTLDAGGFADFERSFPISTVVTLTADAWADGREFCGWRVDGLWLNLSAPTLEWTVTGDLTVEAAYYEASSGDGRPGAAGSTDPGSMESPIGPVGGTIDGRQ
ncbi:MAG TPA: hypothetical protein VM243_10670 [Phycisphaerae bacterium]|nr:hypothetical protein [Phycisphaerae bacterium]